MSAKTRVPPVLRDLAQRCLESADTSPRSLPARLRIEVDFTESITPTDAAAVLEVVAEGLKSGESLRGVTYLLGDLVVALRPCALRSYLVDLHDKGMAAQKPLFDEY